MAHFAEIDENNIVTRVVVVDDAHEADGQQWCVDFFGGGIWYQTSYNGNIRKNFAGVGFTYDIVMDAFIAPQPHPSWTLDGTTCQWYAPTPMPTDGAIYEWDEPTLSWVVMV